MLFADNIMQGNNGSVKLQNCPENIQMRFVDDSHTRFQERSHADKFLKIWNKQDPAIKYTVEFEDHKYSLNSLDINITNNSIDKKYKFKVHWKNAITNMHIKPNSCVDPCINQKCL